MQDFEKYKSELENIKSHKIINSKHILSIDDYANFYGFCERDIWGNFLDDLQYYEDWLKEN